MSSEGNHRFVPVKRLLSYFGGSEVEDAKGEKKERRKDEMDLHFGRTFMVLGFVIALVAGMFSVAGAAISIDPTPTISLVGDQEAAGHPGHGMISIGDTIVVSVDVTIGPVDSILSVIADMRKYGGSQYDTLSTFRGQDAWVS
ncbi:MAG TPA: hypothetical protein VMU02_02070, partial [bacterium]|nr:hypothetical protein [bacterium]